MKKRAYKFITFLLLSAFVTGTIFSGSASIFCFADDGHVELEPIYSACCTEETHAETSTDFHDDSDGCNDCSDIEVTNHLWSKRDSSTKLNQLNKLHTLNHSTIDFNQTTSQMQSMSSSIKNSFAEDKTHISISSTVILC